MGGWGEGVGGQKEEECLILFGHFWIAFLQTWYDDVVIVKLDSNLPAFKVTAIYERRNICARVLANFSVEMDKVRSAAINS